MIATTRQDEIKWFAEYPAQKCHVSLIALWMFRLDSFHYIGRMPLSRFSVCLFSLIPLSKALENIMCRSGEMFMAFFRLRVQKWKQSRCVFQIQFYLWLFFPWKYIVQMPRHRKSVLFLTAVSSDANHYKRNAYEYYPASFCVHLIFQIN